VIIGYARCSTAKQKESLSGQIDQLRNQMGAEIIFSEIASGRSSARPELDKMLAYARSGDTIAVLRLDRLARSVSDLIQVVGLLSSRNVELRARHEAIDTATATGKLVFHVFCCLAEFEAGLIRERTLAGLESARAKGRLGGRPRKLNDDQVAVLRILKDKSGLSVRALARQQGIAVSTLYSYLGKGD